MRLKKLPFLVVSLVMMLPSSIYAKDIESTIYSKGAVLIEQDSGRILYDRHCFEALPMASTTKIMTCILALEKGNLEDIVEVSERASQAPPVKMKLKKGEKQQLGDLLYSLMLESHNDTAVAIAEHISGSVEAFCEEMTLRAKELGALNTCFETPNGLDSENHYSTPYDLALIMSHAIENEKFLEIISTPHITIPTSEVEGSYRHDLQNKNRFLTGYSGALGGKTGYTSKAGHCFVGAADKNDMQLIGVALGAGSGSSGKTRKYSDVMNMMNYGYKNYLKYSVVNSEEIADSLPIIKGKKEQLSIGIEEQIILPLTEDEKDGVVLKITLPDTLQAPIAINTVIGKIDVVYGNNILSTTNIVANETIEKATAFEQLKRYIKQKI